jgi:hypothetical protein
MFKYSQATLLLMIVLIALVGESSNTHLHEEPAKTAPVKNIIFVYVSGRA